MIQIICVAVAGAAGALCRWGTGRMAVRLFGPDLDDMITDGLITLEKNEVIRYHSKKPS